MANIIFGTDGWRAVIDKDFTLENVKRITFAIAKYCYDNFGKKKKILIGYDPRYNADKYACFSAEILSLLGFNIILSSQIIATPVLAYAAKHYNANAIMFTASHNPAEYLGMKFIPDYAGPATEEITKEIVSNIDKNINKYKIHPKSYIKQSFDNIYIKHLKSIIDFKNIHKSKIKINYDGMHGAASELFVRILKENQIGYNAFNLNPDDTFGGKMPDPKEKYLQELKTVSKKTNKIGLSNDGDGDRFGAFNEEGEFVTANEIIAILFKHLKENKKHTGKLVKTIGASSMLNIIAAKHNTELIETKVGFKWVGQAMRENDVIIGGEESGGLSIKDHIPEKDGILANLLILEAMAYSRKTLKELQDELHKETGVIFFNDRIDIKFDSIDKQEEVIKKFDNINSIEKFKIKNKNTIEGIKLYLDDDLSWILVRKSGTEPLLRIYFESDSKDKLSELKEAALKLSKN